MPFKDKEKQKLAQHESYLRNKNIIRQRAQALRVRNREYVENFKKGKQCIYCGEDRLPCLEFHHKFEKTDVVISLCYRGFSLERIQEEIDKCDIVCRKCHRLKHPQPRKYENIGDCKSKSAAEWKALRKYKHLQVLDQYKAALRCSMCEEDRPQCLVFHHKNKHEKEYSISDMVNTKHCSLERIFDEIYKCIVLCENCHSVVHFGD